MKKKCPNCDSNKTRKYGKANGIQVYKCSACEKKFSGKRRIKTKLIKQVWKEYVFNKQTLRELKNEYTRDKRVLRNYLEQYTPPLKTHDPRKINLVVDGTYFGERITKTIWCLVVFRDPKRRENIWWKFCDTETTSVYREGKEHLEGLGYTIMSVTGDGFGGIRQAFSDIPYQMCQVHMERLIIQRVTQQPQTEAGIAILALTKSIFDTDSKTFNHRLNLYIEKYRDFLNEKTIHPMSLEKSWTHENVRLAVFSLIRFREFLFTYEKDKRIYRTTNSIEGHFSHIKDILKIHRGLSKEHKQKILHSILLASSISPSEAKLKHVL